MAAWSFSSFLCNMEDITFNNFKSEFAETSHFFIKENNPAQKAAYTILFSEKHFQLLDCDELSMLIDALFSNAMKDMHWLANYMVELLTYLPKDNDAKKTGYEGRADKYYKHIHDTLPNRFKNGLKEGKDLNDIDMFEILRDQVRFVFAFRNQWNAVNTEAAYIDTIDLSLNGHETANDLFFCERPQQQPVEDKKLLGIKIPAISPLQKLPAHGMNGDDKQLAILVTRALLCDLLSGIKENMKEE